MKPVVVAGTTFVDIKCFPERQLDYAGRNLGRVRFFQGGVGRNVAETLALLGAPVRFASSVTPGGLGAEVLARLAAVGVRTEGVGQQAEGGMGMWVAILEATGDVALSVSQMPDLAPMKSAWRRVGAAYLDGAALGVLELDLDAEMARMVLAGAAAAGVPVVGLPGNFSVIRAHPDLLRGLHTFILNRHEAGLLLGTPVSPEPEQAVAAARAVCARGPRSAVITLGARGCAAAGALGEAWAPAVAVDVVDTSGAGDAFVAGYAYAVASGAALAGALGCAARVAAWTVNAAESVCPDLAARRAADPWPGWTARLPAGPSA